MDQLSRLQVWVDAGCAELAARRPYYRMRGKPVSEEQAFDLIRRTDNFFCGMNVVRSLPDYVGSYNFDNWVLQQNHFPLGYGWVHVDGTIGCNAITQKYPSQSEFIMEWVEKIFKFPYLDLMIALTDWDEIPPRLLMSDDYDDDFETSEWDESFMSDIVLGVQVSNNTVKLLSADNARKVYRQYDGLYGKDRDKFKSDYYDSRGIRQADFGYLRRCIASYGLDADVILADVPAYIWKDR